MERSKLLTAGGPLSAAIEQVIHNANVDVGFRTRFHPSCHNHLSTHQAESTMLNQNLEMNGTSDISLNKSIATEKCSLHIPTSEAPSIMIESPPQTYTYQQKISEYIHLTRLSEISFALTI
jgi:hypothetical protein